MDFGLLHLLGLHRLRPIHAHLVRKYTGGDTVFPYAEYSVLVGAEHAPGDRPLLCAVRDFAVALDQKASPPAFNLGRLDGVHADARHVSGRAAGITWEGRAGKHLGFAFADRHRRDARFRLSATRAQDFALSRPRSAPS